MKIIRISDGLGNQMYQYAFILNYKLQGEAIKLDIFQEERIKQHNGFELKNIFNIDDKLVTKKERIKLLGPIFYYKNLDLHFLKILRKVIQIITLKKFTPNFRRYIGEYESLNDYCFNQKYLNIKSEKTYFQGYFQSHKYFDRIKNEISKVFSFPEIKKEEQNNFNILKKIKDSEFISVHIRRGDYLTIDSFNICDIDYYRKAFNFVIKKLNDRKIGKKKISFFIFSNDIAWSKKNLDFSKDYDLHYVDWNKKEDSYKDMQLMSECKHNIIPNSTFSWWGAYLNKNPDKIVVAPKYWFKGVRATEDRVPRDWFLV